MTLFDLFNSKINHGVINITTKGLESLTTLKNPKKAPLIIKDL